MNIPNKHESEQLGKAVSKAQRAGYNVTVKSNEVTAEIKNGSLVEQVTLPKNVFVRWVGL